MEESKKILFVTLILMIMTITGFSSSTFASDVTKHLLLDVRTVEEWNRGHLEDTVLVPYDQISKSIGTVAKDKSQRIYVYCRSGRRSAIAKKTLDQMGYKDVVNLGSMEDAARILKLKIVK